MTTTRSTVGHRGQERARIGGTRRPPRLSYDSLGRITSSTSASGRTVTFTPPPDVEGSAQVLKQTGGGVTTNLVATVPEASPASYRATLPDGTVQTRQIGLDGSDQITSADGSTWSAVYSPDPRFGMQAPLSTQTRTTPGGLVNVSSTTKTVTLATANDPFSTALEIDTQTINGQTWTTTYCGPSATNCTPNTTTTTSPMGRTTTTTRDAYAEPVTTSVPNMAASTTSYDSHGRLSSSTQGTFVQNGTSFPQTYLYGYDAHGYPSSTTDPMGNVTSLLNTLADDRPTR